MAEGFEPYHVPQHSRRDKLRVNQQGCVDHLLGCAPLVPLYDPSLITTDLINLQRRRFNLGANASADVKEEEGVNLMGFMGGISMISAANPFSSSTDHMFVDPQLSVQLSPNTVQDISGSSDVYTTHHYKGFLDQSFHGNELVMYKPGHEPNGTYAATSGQSLSLSLSSHASNLPLDLNLQRYDSSMFRNNKVIGGYIGGGNLCSSSSQLARSPLPLGPFTGYSSVLKESKFLKPAQQLLEEICDVGRGIFADKIEADFSLMEPPMEALVGNGVDDYSPNCTDGSGQTRNKSRLLSLLNEVYKRYKQYYQQLQAVFTSFESVAGLSSAAPFASMAIKAMSKHFRCLRNAITELLQFPDKTHGKLIRERDETRRLENLGVGAYGQTPFLNSELVDQPVWRPQRGLPERAVTVLRAWLFDHFLHPYPTDTDKLMLAKQTGLSRNQVSNWFINARVRLWKPMVEEIHTLETRQVQKTPQREEHDVNRLANSRECEIASSDLSLKRCRNDFTNSTPHAGSRDTLNFPLEKSTSTHHPLFGVNNGVGCSGVSLTLGLHQNGMGMPETYHINAARRFGLDSHGVGYHELSGFEANQRPFGRDIGRDMVGTHTLHDFQESNH